MAVDCPQPAARTATLARTASVIAALAAGPAPSHQASLPAHPTLTCYQTHASAPMVSSSSLGMTAVLRPCRIPGRARDPPQRIPGAPVGRYRASAARRAEAADRVGQRVLIGRVHRQGLVAVLVVVVAVDVARAVALPQRIFQAPPLDPPVIGLPMAMGLTAFAPLILPSWPPSRRCPRPGSCRCTGTRPGSRRPRTAGWPVVPGEAVPAHRLPERPPGRAGLPYRHGGFVLGEVAVAGPGRGVAAPPVQTNSPNGSKFASVPVVRRDEEALNCPRSGCSPRC